MNIDSEPIQETIRQLVSRRVAITSTLAIFESFFPVPASLRDHSLAAAAIRIKSRVRWRFPIGTGGSFVGELGREPPSADRLAAVPRPPKWVARFIGW